MEIGGALAQLRRATGLPTSPSAAWWSPAGRGSASSELSGTTAAALRSLAVTSGSGLGGKAVALARPVRGDRLLSSRQISHEYIVPVAAEEHPRGARGAGGGQRRVRGVLYGALRSAQPLGDRTLGAAVAAARDVEQGLAVPGRGTGLLAAAWPERPAPVRRRLGTVREGARGALRRWRPG
ncbi:hypothetical protein LT493_32020 [Streptomyces tricolor]|nr:hypothetical protein [Streptomyces tricolor]